MRIMLALSAEERTRKVFFEENPWAEPHHWNSFKDTLHYQNVKLNILYGDLLYEVAKGFGILWLISKIPFLTYEDWIKERILIDKK